jgi:hypothetical protein
MFFAEKAKSHAINQLLHLLSNRARPSHSPGTTLAQLAGRLAYRLSFRLQIITLTLHFCNLLPAIGSGLFYLLFSF